MLKALSANESEVGLTAFIVEAQQEHSLSLEDDNGKKTPPPAV